MIRLTLTFAALATLSMPGYGQNPLVNPVPTPPPPSAVQPPYPLYPPKQPPAVIAVPAGHPMAGFYKTGNLLVGADGNFPFDTGEWVLGGFDGLTRSTGTFSITLPRPVDVNPINTPVPYRQHKKFVRGYYP
jgi:hypothetical protein